jgi:hypothetical protein
MGQVGRRQDLNSTKRLRGDAVQEVASKAAQRVITPKPQPSAYARLRSVARAKMSFDFAPAQNP